MTIYGYELVKWRDVAVGLAILLTAGLLWLPLYWVPKWKLQLTHRKAALHRANRVLVEVSE